MAPMSPEVFDALQKRLKGEQAAISGALQIRKAQMHRLVAEQTVLKRERAALGALIRSLSPLPPKE
jgi:hypothetical protein